MIRNSTLISVIIPSFNGSDKLIRCIKSLAIQSLKPFEIIVIDNHSDDDTLEKLEKLAVNISLKIVKNKKNLGVTGGRNKGIDVASKDSYYLLFFDHDMIADKNMILELLSVAESFSDIGIVTPKIYYWTNKKRIWSAGTGVNLFTGQTLFRGGEDKGQYDEVCKVQVAPAALLVKRQVIEKIKGFDPVYFATYEDTDFCFRANITGWITYYTPKAIAYHDLPTDLESESKRLLTRSYYVAKNRILFMRKYGRPTFYIFLPFFALYYFRLSLRYKELKRFYDYFRGTIDGILNKKL